MRAFWKRQAGHELGRSTLAAVNPLRIDHLRVRAQGDPRPDQRWTEVDARYFCVMGFTLGSLTAEVIAHECVHAAYAFAARRARTWWDERIDQNDEEAIAYPVGLLVTGVTGLFEAHGYPVRKGPSST
jgi:hypothetical protein